MAELFVKENFSKDFKETLGFVDADIRYERLKSAIGAAVDEITELIGQTLYDEAAAAAEDNQLKVLVKYAVFMKAYIIYAPTADLAVTNKGRLMRRDDKEVAAFEWQINANNDALEQLYYRHLDRLLKYLAVNNKKVLDKQFDTADLLVPSLAEFQNHFNINGSHLLYLKLVPALRECEKLELAPRVLPEIYADKAALAQEEILLALLQKACVYYALAWGIRRLNVQLFPKGVLQPLAQTNKRSSGLEYAETAMVFEADYKAVIARIEEDTRKRQLLLMSPPAPDAFDDPSFFPTDRFLDL